MKKIIVLVISPIYLATIGTILVIGGLFKVGEYFKGILALLLFPIVSIVLFCMGLLLSIYNLIYE